MKNENREHCKYIAEKLDRIVNGELFICPECGEWISDDDGAVYDEMHDAITCQHCNAEFNSDDAEPVSLYDYFDGDSIYNLEWRLDSNKEYKSVSIMVACGGPNIYIDTGSCQVELYWWGDNAEYPISYETRDAIDEFFSELFNC